MEHKWQRLSESEMEGEIETDLKKEKQRKDLEMQQGEDEKGKERKEEEESSDSDSDFSFSSSGSEGKGRKERKERKEERNGEGSFSINVQNDENENEIPNEETSLSSNNANSRNANSRRVRRNVQENLFNMSGITKCTFFTDLIFHFTQMAAILTILIISWNDSCDSNLRIFLIGHLFRSFFLFPVMIHRKLYSPDDRYSCSNKLYSFMNFLGTLWFLFGNWWLFSSSTCRENSPLIYFTSLILILIGYFFLAFPFFLCLGITFCLPCILFAAGRVAENDTSKGASSNLIESLPEETFEEGKIEKEDAQCVICLNEYEKGEKLKRLPCKHHFHSKCIEQWLKINKHCPLCMQNVEPGPPAEEA